MICIDYFVLTRKTHYSRIELLTSYNEVDKKGAKCLYCKSCEGYNQWTFVDYELWRKCFLI